MLYYTPDQFMLEKTCVEQLKIMMLQGMFTSMVRGDYGRAWDGRVMLCNFGGLWLTKARLVYQTIESFTDRHLTNENDSRLYNINDIIRTSNNVRCSMFELFQFVSDIVCMNLQKADGNRFDYFVFIPVYCDRPTQLYLKGRGGAKNWGTLSRGFGLRSFRPEISAWGVFVYIFYRSFPKFPEVVSRGFPKYFPKLLIGKLAI